MHEDSRDRAPVVAIVGAPNVGKSTLFNRLVGGRTALVTPEPGTTRDRIYGSVGEGSVAFRLVDTGGLTGDKDSLLAREIEQQVAFTLREAALVLLVVDVRRGVTALDEELAGTLRRRSLPILLVANKVDAPSVEAGTSEFYSLGLGAPIPISAAHGIGTEELLAAVEEALGRVTIPPGSSEPEVSAVAIRVAIVGRPNVGKSSLLNRLLGEERLIVSEIPGTTRDAVDTFLERDGRRYLLVDTAGIRRPGKVGRETEGAAVGRAQASIRRADVVVLVVDASQGFAAQDAHIAGLAAEAGRPLVVVVNKWDLVDDREAQAKLWEETVRERLKFAKEVSVLLVSAKTNQRVPRILDRVDATHAAGAIRVPTPQLNRWLQEESLAERTGPARGGSVRLFYAAQTGIHPPRFVIFCSRPESVHFSLRRRLENSLRDRFGFGPSPLRLRFRSRHGQRPT